MSATNQLFNVSGALIEATLTGSHALQLVMLCGVTNGSVVVPVSVNSVGAVITV